MDRRCMAKELCGFASDLIAADDEWHTGAVVEKSGFRGSSEYADYFLKVKVYQYNDSGSVRRDVPRKEAAQMGMKMSRAIDKGIEKWSGGEWARTDADIKPTSDGAVVFVQYMLSGDPVRSSSDIERAARDLGIDLQ